MDPQAQKRIDRLRQRVQEVLGETYSEIEFLDEGGMGAVFTGKHQRLGRTDAIKVLFSDSASGADALERFKGEWQTIAALGRCPYIISIYEADHDEDRDLAWLAEEFIDGQSLKDRLLQGQPNRAEALRIAHQVATGLDYAHQRGIIHRDVKPANVLIDQATQEAILTDFGLARFQGDDRLTQTHMAVGTLAYMSPEALRGSDPAPSMDAYSFGVLLYELLTGKKPFEGPDVIQKQLQESPPDPRTSTPDLSPALADLVLRLLSKEPEERPPLKTVCRILDSDISEPASETDATIAVEREAAAAPGLRETKSNGKSAKLWIVGTAAVMVLTAGWFGRGLFVNRDSSPDTGQAAQTNTPLDVPADSIASGENTDRSLADLSLADSSLADMSLADSQGAGDSAKQDTPSTRTEPVSTPDSGSQSPDKPAADSNKTPAQPDPGAVGKNTPPKNPEPKVLPKQVFVQVGISGELRREARAFRILINGQDTGLTGPQLVTWDRPGNDRATVALRHAVFDFSPPETTLVFGAKADTVKLTFRAVRK